MKIYLLNVDFFIIFLYNEEEREFMQTKKKIELSSIEATAYWWTNIIKDKVRELIKINTKNEKEISFVKLFYNYTEADWRNLYLELIKFVTLNVNNYIPTCYEYGIDAFNQSTDKAEHDQLNIELSKILDKPFIPDIRLASNSSKDSTIYTNIFGASVWHKSGGLTKLPTKYKPTYILTGNEEELYLRNLLLATIIVLNELDKNFHSISILRKVFCQEYQKNICKKKLEDVIDLFNIVFNQLNDDKLIIGRCYNDRYYITILKNDYVKLNKYILVASQYANKILELNIKENDENNKKLINYKK